MKYPTLASITAIFFLMILSYTPNLLANSLHGGWVLEKAIGAPCSTQIEKLSYIFRKDGTYDIRSVMNYGIKTVPMSADGTYTADGKILKGQAKGHPLGPFPYRFQEQFLIITQPSPRCEIYLVKGDPDEE